MDRRKIEAYLLETFNPREFVGTFEAYVLKKVKLSAILAAFFYIPLWVVVLFDSWGSLASFTLSESIDTTLVVLVFLLVPICAFVTILTARIRLPRMTVGSFSPYPGRAMAGAATALTAAGSIWFATSRGNIESEPISTVNGLILFTTIFLLSTAAWLYKLYLLRKYCPYLAYYVGGEIKRPGEDETTSHEN